MTFGLFYTTVAGQCFGSSDRWIEDSQALPRHRTAKQTEELGLDVNARDEHKPAIHMQSLQSESDRRPGNL